MLSPTQKYIAKKKLVSEAMQVVSDFPMRYSHYATKQHPGIWKCNCISEHGSQIVLQLVDKKFEPPRGNVRFEAPFLYIEFEQAGEDTVICWKLRWQRWITLLIWGALLLFLLVAGPLLSMVEGMGAKCVVGAALLYVIGIVVVWLVKNVRHDRLTNHVFHSLLQKNL